MFSLVTPSIRRTHIPIALDSLPTAPPERLVPCPPADALNLSTLVIMPYGTAPIVVLDVKETFVAARAVEQRGRGDTGEERGEDC
jgi:hypothetical protein